MKHPPCERRTMENYKADRSSAYRFNYRAESIDSLKQSELIDKPTKFHVSAQLESTALALKELKGRGTALMKLVFRRLSMLH